MTQYVIRMYYKAAFHVLFTACHFASARDFKAIVFIELTTHRKTVLSVYTLLIDHSTVTGGSVWLVRKDFHRMMMMMLQEQLLFFPWET